MDIQELGWGYWRNRCGSE